MAPNEINGLLAGILFSISGLSGLSRHFLLEPSLPPKVRIGYPKWLLHVAFASSVIMLYAGMRYLVDALSSHTAAYTGVSVLIAWATCSYQSALLYDTWNRRPDGYLLQDILSTLKGMNKE